MNEKLKWINAVDLNNNSTNWISEVAELNGDLPSKCMFQKVLTGCGGTSLAMWSKKPYVIAMPYKAGIDNKMQWCNENNIKAVGVHSELATTETEIKQANKIIVTYDSLPKVSRLLEEAGRKGEFKLLVDEYHLITKSGNFRGDAIRNVLKEYKNYNDWLFMTATPVHRNYLHNSLIDVPEVRIKWNNIMPVNLLKCVIDSNKLYSTVAGVAWEHFTGNRDGNGYFFMNTVKGIIEVIQYLKEAGVTPENVKVVCANTDENKELFKEGKCARFKIESATSFRDFTKKINLITSTCFESADILDNDGVTYIVTNGDKDHTKYDITTTIPQIIGRIRDSRFKNMATLIYSPNSIFSFTSKEQYEEFTLKGIQKATKWVKKYNEADEDDREFLKASVRCSPYIITSDNYSSVEVDEMAYKAQMSDFDAIHHTYNVQRDVKTNEIIRGGIKKSFNIGEVPYNSEYLETELDRLTEKELGLKKPDFKEYCELYNSIRFEGKNKGSLKIEIKTSDESLKIKLIEKEYPFIRDAFEKLGYTKIKALEYRITDVKAELLKESNLSNPYKVARLLDKNKYRVGKKIPKSEIKQDLQRVFDMLNIPGTAKAEDLGRVFVISHSTAKRQNKWVGAFRIVAQQFSLAA